MRKCIACLVVSIPRTEVGLHAIVWNTTRTSSLALLNFLGRIDGGQLGRFSKIKELLAVELHGCPALFHVLHHKIGMPVEIDYHFGDLSHFEHRVQFASMAMQNGASLLKEIGKHEADTVILHGHHHVRFAAQVEGSRPTTIDVV